MSTIAVELPGRAEAAVPSVRARIDSIDLLRGLVMVLMALDHVRDFFTDQTWDPLDFQHTTTALFLTRWVTHFCAPVFVFLAGVSANRVGQRLTRAQLSRFLWTRGLWLVFLEVSFVNFAWTFQLPGQSQLFYQVIWAIGWSMVILAALIHLPVRAVGAIGVVVILGHNALDGIAPAQLGAWAPLWNVLHVRGMTDFGFVLYPLVPWFAVMAAGYAFGAVFDLEGERRRRLMRMLGLAALALFLLLRLPNVYGDPHPWSAQATGVFTLLSVINVEKYPPSLSYLLITLGPALIALAAFEQARGRVAAWLVTIGRVPLFFYVGHLVLAHLVAGLWALEMGFGTRLLTNFPEAPGWGFPLPVAYAVWAGVVVALYPACRWFAGVKARRRDWWLSYL